MGLYTGPKMETVVIDPKKTDLENLRNSLRIYRESLKDGLDEKTGVPLLRGQSRSIVIPVWKLLLDSGFYDSVEWDYLRKLYHLGQNQRVMELPGAWIVSVWDHLNTVAPEKVAPKKKEISDGSRKQKPN